MTAVYAMLTVLAVLVLLLVALLAIPVTLTFDVSRHEVFRSEARVHWAFGLVGVTLPSTRSEASTGQAEKTRQSTGRPKRSPGRKRRVFAAFRLARFRRRIIRFIRDLWRAIHKKNLSLKVRVGLGDPADTGQLWAVCGPVAGALANIRDASIQLEPEFVHETLELDSTGQIRLIPLQIIGLAAGLLLSPSVWQGVTLMRSVGR